LLVVLGLCGSSGGFVRDGGRRRIVLEAFDSFPRLDLEADVFFFVGYGDDGGIFFYTFGHVLTLWEVDPRLPVLPVVGASGVCHTGVAVGVGEVTEAQEAAFFKGFEGYAFNFHFVLFFLRCGVISLFVVEW